MTQNLQILKKSGELVPFDIEKLRNSLLRSGASTEMVEEVMDSLLVGLHSGMSTHKVYSQAYQILSKLSHRSAGRYRLKKAIMELGPTGFPFEQYVAALFQARGIKAVTGQIIEGRCVQHEVDVVGENNEKVIVVECKFHRDGNTKSDVKIPLYIHSRFEDIYLKWKEEGRIGNREFEGYLITNTRFTEDAVNYGKCAGLHLISWDYPQGHSLRDLIDASGLHPITSLKSLNSKEKESILGKGIVLCRDLNDEVLKQANISLNKIPKILLESHSLSE